MRDFMAATKALADENRVRVLLALRQGELCVCQIVELLGLATSTVSKHMSVLKQACLVDSRKEGRWIYYRLAGDDAPETVRRTVPLTLKLLADDPQSRLDQQRLDAIRRLDPQDLCVARDDSRQTSRDSQLDGWAPMYFGD
jgi:DNA-binding transcriptional ArsR family regulator